MKKYVGFIKLNLVSIWKCFVKDF